MKRHMMLFALLFCYFSALSSCFAQIQTVTAEWKQKDERLSKKVTIWQPKARMAEVVASMEKQTGVSLSISHDAVFSGMELCVFVKDKPLSEVMSALWSFLSVRRHAYQWERHGKSDYTYVFVETSSSKQFSKNLLTSLQADYEAHIALLCQMADYDVEQRKKFRDVLITSMHCETNKEAVDFVLGYEMLWNRILLFKQVLTPDQQKKVLRREETIRVPIDSLTIETKSLLRRSMHADEQIENLFDSSKESKAYAVFSTNFEVLDENRLSPNLFCGVKTATYGILSGTESGYFRDNGLRDYIAKEWMLTQDQTVTSKKTEQVILLGQKANSTSRSATDEKSRFRWGRVMERIAEATDTPIIAQFVQEFNRPEVTTNERTLRAVLDEGYKDFERIIAKWSGNFLLLREPIWALIEDSLLTYSQVKKMEAVNAGEIKSLVELRDSLCNLTEFQWRRVKKEYRALSHTDPLRDMLMLTKTIPELLRPSGMTLDASLREELQTRGHFTGHGLMKPDAATRARFVLQDQSAPGRLRTMVRLEAFAEKERAWIMVWAVVITPSQE